MAHLDHFKGPDTKLRPPPPPPEFQQYLNYDATGHIGGQSRMRGLISLLGSYGNNEQLRSYVFNGTSGTNMYNCDEMGNRTEDLTGETGRAYSHENDKPLPSSQFPPNAQYSVTNATLNARFTYDLQKKYNAERKEQMK